MPGLYTGVVYQGYISGLYTRAIYRGCVSGLYIRAIYWGCVSGLYSRAIYQGTLCLEDQSLLMIKPSQKQQSKSPSRSSVPRNDSRVPSKGKPVNQPAKLSDDLDAAMDNVASAKPRAKLTRSQFISKRNSK